MTNFPPKLQGSIPRPARIQLPALAQRETLTNHIHVPASDCYLFALKFGQPEIVGLGLTMELARILVGGSQADQTMEA